MAKSSSGEGSGCGFAIVALLVFSFAIYLLKLLWWLFFILAAGALFGIFWLYRENKKEATTAESSITEDEYYTQFCPNCGAQIKVSVYERTAKCSYCNSAFPSANEPIQKPPKIDTAALTAKPSLILLAAAVILVVLGIIGFNLNAGDTDDDSPAATQTTIASTSANTSTSSKSALSDSAAAMPIEDITLVGKTEFLEYSSKDTDPTTLVKSNAANVKIESKNNVSLKEVGPKKATYEITSNGQSATRTVEFTVRDTKKPTIKLADENPSIELGGAYDPLSAIEAVSDVVDGELPFVETRPEAQGTKAGYEKFYDEGWYTYEGSIDPATPGTYYITFIACDKHGNETTKELPVAVVEPVWEEPVEAAAPAAPSYTYIVNTNSGKFHIQGCPAAKQMKDSNKAEITATREEMISMGYDPCGRCNP